MGCCYIYVLCYFSIYYYISCKKKGVILMIKVDRLDHLVLTVKDIDKTVEFYEKLGFEKEIFKQTRVALKFGLQKINLHQLGNEFEPKAFNVKEGSADLCFI